MRDKISQWRDCVKTLLDWWLDLLREKVVVEQLLEQGCPDADLKASSRALGTRHVQAGG